MSVIKQSFEGHTVELYLPGKRVKVLRSESAYMLTIVGEPAVVQLQNDNLRISSDNWLIASLKSLLGFAGRRTPPALLGEDQRIAGFDFLIVLPPSVTTIRHIKIGSEYNEAFVD